ncbi:hypothetical protein Tco_1295595, partial [Tanacetum coccineum]
TVWFDLIFWKPMLLMDEFVKECLEEYWSYFIRTKFLGMSASVSDAPLSLNENETTLLNAAKEYGEEVKGKDAQVSGEGLVMGPKDMSSKRRATKLEFEHEKVKVRTLRVQRT